MMIVRLSTFGSTERYYAIPVFYTNVPKKGQILKPTPDRRILQFVALTRSEQLDKKVFKHCSIN